MQMKWSLGTLLLALSSTPSLSRSQCGGKPIRLPRRAPRSIIPTSIFTAKAEGPGGMESGSKLPMEGAALTVTASLNSDNDTPSSQKDIPLRTSSTRE
jgi:hypothetical protein